MSAREWMDEAACSTTDPDMFFPELGDNTTRDARAICSGCPVAIECLEYALSNGFDTGVWGGTVPRQRRDMKRRSVGRPRTVA